MNKGLMALLILAILHIAACANNTNKKNTLASLGSKQVKIEKNVRIDSGRQKVVSTYRDIMNTAPKDNLRAEALRRLADLELETSEEMFQEQLAQASDVSPVAMEQQLAMREASYDKAIKLYQNALAEGISKGQDEDIGILYQLSKAYEQVGDREKAFEVLTRILELVPDVNNRDEIHFRRAELLFNKKKFTDAEAAYGDVIEVGSGSPYYEKAISKRGWAIYKQNDYNRALGSFFSLLDIKLVDSSGKFTNSVEHLRRGDKELVADLFRVISLSFNEMGGAEEIQPYFDRLGHRPYESRLYRALGDQYMEQGRIKDAADTYKTFADLNKTHVLAPNFDMLAIDAYAAGGFTEKVLESKVSFSDLYRVNGDFWSELHGETQQQILPLLKTNTEELARHFHSVAQKSNKPKDYQLALYWYKQYLVSFPQSKKAPEINFLLAETMFENKQFKTAAQEYEKTAYQYKKSGKNAEAGYAALLSYTEQSKRLKGKEKDAWDRIAIGSSLRFGKTFPKDKRSASVVTKAAEDLFALKKYDQAASAARGILELSSHTKTDMRRTAWLIVAQSELQKGEYARAESAYKIALTLADNNNEVKKTITQGLAASIYKRAEQLKQRGDVKNAVAQFARVSNIAPNSKITVAAEYDMAAALVQAEDWLGAISAFEKFREKHPSHKLINQINQTLAAAYVKTKQPVQAAREFENMLAYQRDPQAKRDMAWHIAELYEQAKRKRNIIDAYKYYIRSFPSPVEQAMEARHKLATLYENANQISKSHYWLKQIVKHDKRAGAERSDRIMFLAANASFELVQPKIKAFNDIQLVAPLKKNLKKKKKRLKKAVDALTKAANYGVAEVTTASVFRLAEVYANFGEALISSERPKGLSAQEKEQYDILLEEQAYPFEEKSIDFHVSNADKVLQGIYDNWVKKSFSALEKLRPVQYAKAERRELFADNFY